MFESFVSKILNLTKEIKLNEANKLNDTTKLAEAKESKEELNKNLTALNISLSVAIENNFSNVTEIKSSIKNLTKLIDVQIKIQNNLNSSIFNLTTLIEEEKTEQKNLDNVKIKVTTYQKNLNNNPNILKVMVEIRNFSKVCKSYFYYYNTSIRILFLIIQLQLSRPGLYINFT